MSVFVFGNLMTIIVLESLDMSIISFKTCISCSLFISICKLSGKYNSSHSCFRDRFSCLKSNNLNFRSENVLDHISFFFFYNALFFELRLFFVSESCFPNSSIKFLANELAGITVSVSHNFKILEFR